jgi:hypothetical protein
MKALLPEYPFPETGGRYLVKCEKFLCFAVFDKNNKWKSLHDGRELPDVMHFYPTQPFSAAAASGVRPSNRLNA